MNALQTMKWLVKREYWEHRGGMLWAQVGVGGFFALMIVLVTLFGLFLLKSEGMEINGVHVTDLVMHNTSEHRADAGQALAMSYLFNLMPLLAVMAIVVFFFSLSSLYDDRKDRSILFWKSMPPSDSLTVLSKLFTILVVTPAVPVLVAIATTAVFVLSFLFALQVVGVSLFAETFSSPDLFLLPLEIAACLPVFALWAFPSVAWFMLVSSWARQVPFLWAVGIPVVFGVLISIAEGMLGVGIPYEWYWENIVGRLFAGFVPGTWFAFFEAAGNFEMEPGRNAGMDLLLGSWSILGYAKVWIAAALGVGMIALSIRVRRWREDAG
jgi:ABC-2 type transport system permease protein